MRRPREKETHTYTQNSHRDGERRLGGVVLSQRGAQGSWKAASPQATAMMQRGHWAHLTSYIVACHLPQSNVRLGRYDYIAAPTYLARYICTCICMIHGGGPTIGFHVANAAGRPASPVDSPSRSSKKPQAARPGRPAHLCSRAPHCILERRAVVWPQAGRTVCVARPW